MIYAIQVEDHAGRWRIARPLCSSLIGALGELRRTALELPAAHARLVDALTLEVLATISAGAEATQRQPAWVQ